MTQAGKITIGAVMTYMGSDWEAAQGERVSVCYVMRGRGRSDDDPDQELYQGQDRLIRDNGTLEAFGGVTKDDLVDVVSLRSDGSERSIHFNARLGELLDSADPALHLQREPPMLVRHLRALLARCDGNARILICGAGSESSFRGITTREECEDERLATNNGLWRRDVLLISEDDSVREMPENAWGAARRTYEQDRSRRPR